MNEIAEKDKIFAMASELNDTRGHNWGNELIRIYDKNICDMVEAELKAEGFKGLVDQLKKENAKNQTLIETIRDIATKAPELNMGNYTEDQVKEINDALIEIFNLIK